jgi:hypothetical protein
MKVRKSTGLLQIEHDGTGENWEIATGILSVSGRSLPAAQTSVCTLAHTVILVGVLRAPCGKLIGFSRLNQWLPVQCKQSDDFIELWPKHGNLMAGYIVAFDECSHGTFDKS